MLPYAQYLTQLKGDSHRWTSAGYFSGMNGLDWDDAAYLPLNNTLERVK